ncbi:hypothetical protein ACHAXT_005093 [Thalassiosira profunda]
MKRRRCPGTVFAAAALGGCAILLGRVPVAVAFRSSQLPAPRTSHDASHTSSSFGPIKGSNIARRAAASSSAAAAHAGNAADSEEEGSVVAAFVAPAMRVYIEDTDAYGVVYNSNYLRAYERALHSAAADDSAGEGDDGNLQLLRGGALGRDGWFVLQVTEHKFQSSPALGGEFVVRGKLVERDCAIQEEAGGDKNGPPSCMETWRLQMTSPLSREDEDDGAPAVVYNEATVTIASHEMIGRLPDLSRPQAPLFDDAIGVMARSAFRLHRDEFDAGLAHRLPLRNVLNLFERARTDCLGGPDALRKMEGEDNIVWVVTGVDDMELCNLAAAGRDDDETEEGASDATRASDSSQRVRCAPGDEVTVETTLVPKRGGMVVDFRHALFASARDEGTGDRRLAQARVTVVALDAAKRRPTRRIPAWVWERLGVSELVR